jgi:hypothetical protein
MILYRFNPDGERLEYMVNLPGRRWLPATCCYDKGKYCGAHCPKFNMHKSRNTEEGFDLVIGLFCGGSTMQRLYASLVKE